MKSSWPRRSFESSDIAIYVLVVVSYIAMFAVYGNDLSLLTKVVALGLGIPYLLIGVWGIDFAEHTGRIFVKILLFLAQLVIACTVFYLGFGTTWLLLLPLAAQTVYLFSTRGMIIANLLIFAASLWVVKLLSGDWSGMVQSGVAFIAAQVFVVIFTQIARREQQTRRESERLTIELNEANHKLRQYAAKVEDLATAQERNRLAREIHDGLGHYLTAINMQIKAAQAVLEANPSQAGDALAKAQALAQDALSDVRRSVAALRDEPSLDRPLPDALRTLFDECRSAGIVVEFSQIGKTTALSPQASLALYRAAQEGLTNVRKHALASRVDIRLLYAADAVRLEIGDNGVGARQTENGFGLFGLRERVQLLGGEITIHTAPGEGFRLEIAIPTESSGKSSAL